MKDDCYPSLYLCYSYESAASFVPNIETRNIPPPKKEPRPQRPVLQIHEFNQNKFINRGFWNILTLAMIFAILVVKGYWIVSLTIPAIASYIVWRIVKEAKLEMQGVLWKNENEQRKYEHAVACYELASICYEPNLRKCTDEYYRQLLEEKKRVEHLKSPQGIKDAKFKKLLEGYETIKPPIDLPEDKRVLTGATEKILFEALQARYGSKIRQRMYVPFFDDDLSEDDDVENQFYYVPDVIYCDKSKHILIDIEIDEPYANNYAKTPIHYSFGETPCNDIGRNNFFNNNGWHVLRFAEIQVVRDLDNCVALISSIIENIENLNEYSDAWVECWPEKSNVAFWCEDDSIEMADNNYRDSYLRELRSRNY